MSRSTAGTGPAGRRLLAAIDRHTTSADDVVELTHRPYGRFGLAGDRFDAATVRRIVAAGLAEWVDPASRSDLRIRLTAAGRELLGA